MKASVLVLTVCGGALTYAVLYDWYVLLAEAVDTIAGR